MVKPKPIKNVPMESALLGVLFVLQHLELFKKIDSGTKLGRPYVYSNFTMLCCFVVMLWMRLGSVNALYSWLSHDYTLNAKVRNACGLQTLPDRRTFDRRFASLPFEDLIADMGHQFVIRGLVNAVVVAIDSTIMRAWRGYVHHKKDKEAGRVPRPGIDTEASWTRKLKGFFYGYKLHVITSADPKMAVPLAACTAPANEPDNKFALPLFKRLCLSVVKTLLGDQGYRDGKLFLDVCEVLDEARGGHNGSGGGSLMTWAKEGAGEPAAEARSGGLKKDGTPSRKEMQRNAMKKSDKRFATREGKATYSLRKESVEPAQGRLKDTFNLHTLPVRGAKAVNTRVLGCVFVYQAGVLYKCVSDLENPLRINEVLVS